MLSVTNERGTAYTGVELTGFYVGHCVVGKYLVVFTSNDDSSDNYIYRIEKTSSGYKTIILFHNPDMGKGSWSPTHPIEAIGVYETEFVQKVYWVDGINQPRVINIAKPELKLDSKYLLNGLNLSGTYRNGPKFYNSNTQTLQTLSQELET